MKEISQPMLITVKEFYCKDGFIKISLTSHKNKILQIVSQYMDENSCKSLTDLHEFEIVSLLSSKDEYEYKLNNDYLLSDRQKEILESKNTKYIDKEDLLKEIKKLRAENEYLKLENQDLKQYRDYYKAIFADTFDQFEDHDNAYFNNLKELFKLYMIPDEELNPKALPLKDQLYAFTIFIANYIKDDEFYGNILKVLLRDVSWKNKLNNIILSVLNDDRHKLLKEVITKNEVKKYK